MIIKSFPVGMLQCNCVILGDPATREALVVDPGGDVERIRAELAALDLKVVRIVHTHAHFDHIQGTEELREATGAETLLHPGDAFLAEDLGAQLAWIPGMPRLKLPAPTIDAELSDGGEVRFGEGVSLVLHTPGHTPGSVCFSARCEEGLLLLSGDTLFQQGIGRTDFPGGDSDQLLGSIQDRLLCLDGETRVIPGHGPETTIEAERRLNPFLRGLA